MIDYLPRFIGVAKKDFLLLFSVVFKMSQKPTHYFFLILKMLYKPDKIQQ